jgi:hypothetical protein
VYQVLRWQLLVESKPLSHRISINGTNLAVVRNGRVFTAYRNGVAMGSETNSLVIPKPRAPLTIGQAEGLGFLDGLIDEVSFYRRGMSGPELQAIYAAGSIGKCVHSCSSIHLWSAAKPKCGSGGERKFYCCRNGRGSADLSVAI